MAKETIPRVREIGEIEKLGITGDFDGNHMTSRASTQPTTWFVSKGPRVDCDDELIGFASESVPQGKVRYIPVTHETLASKVKVGMIVTDLTDALPLSISYPGEFTTPPRIPHLQPHVVLLA